ncbi:MAG: GTPase Era [Desulfurella sp.]|jgi:GTP-binding protein Era|uniref:GTPase Era n=1 Tax=Desulfurella multipotens TaxID=79269 RepID=A0A1G6HYX6_9BACT|nr:MULTISPECIES: GTPase Era [Desulfurella]PMP65975.1 MAG: GTPase Era [Desulfurella multipotens]PMP88447.1 MAG: GTPase Era [Desulfurella sp.]SDB99421.1 GTP-binding protein Era [Desulfurella multipotens]HEX13568.1 GTPase Era [Desulfurella acetivorans]
MFKSGYVALIGKPNVGKSTFLNLMIGEKLSIVTNKPQTTRTPIKGILTTDSYQIIFIDTPGIHESQKKLNQVMLSSIKSTIEDADVCLIIADSPGNDYIKNYEDLLLKKNVILLINKADKLTKEQIDSIKAEFLIINPKKIIVTSLLRDNPKDEILNAILEELKEGPQYYAEDEISTHNVRFIVSELIRETLIENLSEELPYYVAVVIDEFKERSENLTYIKAIIYTEKDSQKAIVIGQNGSMLKKIGSSARKKIEDFLGTKVYLDLWVKVKKGWTKNEKLIKEFLSE